MQEDDLALLRQLMERRKLSQTQLSKESGVSQATISRALRGLSEQRRGKARAGLFIYVRNESSRHTLKASGIDAVLRAFENIWDRSDAHASAVARVIDAMDGLRPVGKEEEKE